MPDDLVSRREAWIRRMKNRPRSTGGDKLPPGQHEVKNWPVLDLGHQPVISTSEWKLEVCGEVENPFELDWDAFMRLPQVEQVSDFHCVTTWSRFDNRWKGVTFRTIAEQAVPREAAKFVLCTGSDIAPGTGIPYTTNLPLESAVDEEVLLAHSWEGAPLTREHGGPVRMITPKLYAWKGAKWLRRIEFCPEEKPGFWETRGYSNTGHPWTEDRFSA